MKKFYSSLLIVLLTLFSYAQTPSLQWVKSIGGNGYDIGQVVALDAAGNVYTAGYFDGTADFDPGPGTFTMTSFGLSDIFISKLDAAGNFIWAKRMGGPSTDEVSSMHIDASGNIYTTGHFYATADFDPSPAIYTLTSQGQYDVFISKLDVNGNFIWAKSMGSFGADEGISIDVDGSGNVYTAGVYQFTVDFDPSASTYTLGNQGSSDTFILKLDGAGNFVWVKTFAGNGAANPSSLSLDISGNIITTGVINGNAYDFDPGPATYTLSGAQDIFISKLDASGNFVWAEVIGTAAGQDYAYSLVLDPSANIYLTGDFQYSPDFDPGPATYSLTSAGNFNSFILKLSSGGNFIWAKSFSSPIDSYGTSIALDALNNVYTIGSFEGTTDFDPGVGVYTITPLGLSSTYISKLNASGNFVCALNFDGSGNVLGQSIYVDSFNSIFTTGAFNSGYIDFDPSVNTFSITASGINDVFIHKLIICTAITATINSQNVSCAEGSNGTATITPVGNSPFTYSWSPTGGNTTIASGLSAGIYTCFVSNSCGSATQTVAITQPNSSVIVSALTTNSLLCVGQTATLTANGIGGTGTISYSWIPNGNTQSILVSPNTGTSYTVIATDANNCSSSYVITQNVSTCTNLFEQKINNDEFYVYPNPVNSDLHVGFSNLMSEKYSLQVTNILGQILFEDIIALQQQSFNIQHIPSGIYFVKISNTKLQQVFKIIKE